MRLLTDYRHARDVVRAVVLHAPFALASHWLAPLRETVGNFQALMLETDDTLKPVPLPERRAVLGQRMQLAMAVEDGAAPRQGELFANEEEQERMFASTTTLTLPSFKVGSNAQAVAAIDTFADALVEMLPKEEARLRRIAEQGRQAYIPGANDTADRLQFWTPLFSHG